MTTRDWQAWHAPYDDAGSPLARRLAIVQRRIREAIDAAPAGLVLVCGVFENITDAGFDEIGFDAPEGTFFSVGANRLRGDPRPLERGVRLFRFVGLDALEA